MSYFEMECLALLFFLVCLLVVFVYNASFYTPPHESTEDPLTVYVPRTPSPRALATDLWAHVRAPKDQRILPPLDPKFAAVRKTPCPEFETTDFAH